MTSWTLAFDIKILDNSSRETLLLNTYCKSVLETLSSIKFKTSSNPCFVSRQFYISAIVRDTSVMLAFVSILFANSVKVTFSSIYLSKSFIAKPYVLTVSQIALNVSFTIS